MLKNKITSGVFGLLLAVSAAFALPVRQAEAATSITVCINGKCVTIIIH